MIFGEEGNQGQRPQQQGQQQVRLDASQMTTVYANFFAIAGAPEEVTIYLGANSPMPGMREPVIRISERLIMLPANAKRLMAALQQTIKAHEDRFGPIEITPNQPPQTGG